MSRGDFGNPVQVVATVLVKYMRMSAYQNGKEDESVGLISIERSISRIELVSSQIS